MLKSLRTILQNTVFRGVILFILASFITWGIIDALKYSKKFNIITFGKKLPNVDYLEFMQAKKRYFSQLAQAQNIDLQNQQLQQQIDNLVAGELIRDRLLEGLAAEYHLSLSPTDIFQYLTRLPFFHNKQGQFEQKLFHNFLQHAKMTEQEYLAMVHKNLKKQLLLSPIFNSAFVSPELIKEITNHLQETRLVDLVRIKLEAENHPKTANQEQLLEFYQANLEQFRQPEKLDVQYLVLTREAIQKQLTVTPAEIKEFSDQVDAKLTNSEAIQQLKQQRSITKLQQSTEQLEDDIASGNTLEELAKKHHLPLKYATKLSKVELLAQEPRLKYIDLTEASNRVPYLVSLPENEGLVILEVHQIFPSYVEEFHTVQDKVKKLWQLQETKKANLEKMHAFSKHSSANSLKAGATRQHLEFISHKPISRLTENEDLPLDLLQYLFTAKIDQVSPVFHDQKYAYVGIVRKIQIKPNAKVDESTIKNNIIEGYLQEAIEYFSNRYKVKVKLPS